MTFYSHSHRPTPTSVHHYHDDRDAKRASSPATRSGSGIGTSRSAPRLNMGMATKQILSGIGHAVSSRTSREGKRRERDRGEGLLPHPPVVSTTTAGEKAVESQYPVEKNHVTPSGLGAHFHPC